MNAPAAPSAIHTHVVVGDGITAAAFVETCGLTAGAELIIIGPHADALGRGVAYADDPHDTPWQYAYLLNSPADDIDPAFARWIETNWDRIRTKMEGRKPDWLRAAQPLLDRGDTFGLNVPRAFYGDFMVEKMTKVLATLRTKGVTVTLVKETAYAVEKAGDRLRVRTDAGHDYLADQVDVAPGGPSTQTMDGDDGPFSAPTLFGHEHRIAEHVLAGAEIFCVGANATMLDALRLCQSLVPEDAINFVACSGDGGLPAPLIPRLPRYLTNPNLSRGHATAQSFLTEVWTAMQNARAAGDEMREIRAGFRAYFIDHGLSEFITDPHEARLVPRTLRHWFRGGTRDTILDFHRLMKAGKTRTLAGRVTEIEETATGARVTTVDKAGNITTHDTGFVINCAGAGGNSTYDPLTENMIADGRLDVCNVSGGLAVGPRCETKIKGVRHLSPATSVIGDEVMPMPLYDAHFLRTWAARTRG